MKGNNEKCSLTLGRSQGNNHTEDISVYILQFLIKSTISPKCF